MNGIALPQHVVELNPIISLEVELAYRVSAVFICDALNARKETRHIAIDPNMAERGGLIGTGSAWRIFTEQDTAILYD